MLINLNLMFCFPDCLHCCFDSHCRKGSSGLHEEVTIALTTKATDTQPASSEETWRRRVQIHLNFFILTCVYTLYASYDMIRNCSRKARNLTATRAAIVFEMAHSVLNNPVFSFCFDWLSILNCCEERNHSFWVCNGKKTFVSKNRILRWMQWSSAWNW